MKMMMLVKLVFNTTIISPLNNNTMIEACITGSNVNDECELLIFVMSE